MNCLPLQLAWAREHGLKLGALAVGRPPARSGGPAAARPRPAQDRARPGRGLRARRRVPPGPLVLRGRRARGDAAARHPRRRPARLAAADRRAGERARLRGHLVPALRAAAARRRARCRVPPARVRRCGCSTACGPRASTRCRRGARPTRSSSSAASTARPSTSGGTALLERLSRELGMEVWGYVDDRLSRGSPLLPQPPRRGLGARHVPGARPHAGSRQPPRRHRRGPREQHAPLRGDRSRSAAGSPRPPTTSRSCSSRAARSSPTATPTTSSSRFGTTSPTRTSGAPWRPRVRRARCTTTTTRGGSRRSRRCWSGGSDARPGRRHLLRRVPRRALRARGPAWASARTASSSRTLMERCFGTSDAYCSALRALGHDAARGGGQLPAAPGPLGARARRGAARRGRAPACPGAPARAPAATLLRRIARAQVADVRARRRPTARTCRSSSAADLDALRAGGRLVVGPDRGSPPPDGERVRGYDLLLTSFPHFVERFRALGVRQRVPARSPSTRRLRRPRCAAPGRTVRAPLDVRGRRRPARARATGPRCSSGWRASCRCRRWGYGADSCSSRLAARARYHGEAWGLDMYRRARRSADRAQPPHRRRRGPRQQHAPLRGHRRRRTAAHRGGAATCASSSSRGVEVVDLPDADDLVEKARALPRHDDERARDRPRRPGAAPCAEHTYAAPRAGELAAPDRGSARRRSARRS